MKNQEITILHRCGWVGDGNSPRFSKPDEQGNGLRSMMGLEENDKPVINENCLSEAGKMVFNMIPETRQTEEKKSESNSDAQNHNSENEIKSMLGL